jgi:hypothetical protein
MEKVERSFMRVNRVILLALLPLVAPLSGCGTFWDGAHSTSDRLSDILHDFNPFGTGKKPLPGERRPVFPEGVPGVHQGIPPDLMRHNPQAAEVEQPPGAGPTAGPSAAAEPAPAARPQPKKTVRRARSTTAIEPQSTDPPEDGVWPPPPGR